MPQPHMDNDSIEAVVADAGESERAWLQAADVIVGQHRTRRGARRWVASIRRRFPGCVVAVSRARHGHWLVIGWPGPTVFVRGAAFAVVHAAEVGRFVFQLWASSRGGRS